MSLNYKIKEEEGIVLISFSGNLMDALDGTDFLNEISERLQKGENQVVVDMSGVPRMNSSGLNMMIRLLTKTRKHEGELVLTHLSDKVKELYLTTKLNAIFLITDTLEEAKQKLRKQPENT